MSEFIFEKNTTHHGDCLEIMPQLPSGIFDMILCDLPYGTTACKWDIIIPFEPLWKEYKRLIKDNGVIVLTGAEPFSSLLRCSNFGMYKYDWVWDKCNTSNFLKAKTMPLRRHENVMVFYKEQPTYNPQFEIIGEDDYRYRKNGRGHKETKYSGTVYGNVQEFKREETGKRYPNTILKINSNVRGRLVDTQKPISLFEYFIKTYTNEGDLILDNCAGSGTLGEAAYNTKRNYIMIEKELEHYNIIKEREKKFNSGDTTNLVS